MENYKKLVEADINTVLAKLDIADKQALSAALADGTLQSALSASATQTTAQAASAQSAPQTTAPVLDEDKVKNFTPIQVNLVEKSMVAFLKSDYWISAVTSVKENLIAQKYPNFYLGSFAIVQRFNEKQPKAGTTFTMDISKDKSTGKSTATYKISYVVSQDAKASGYVALTKNQLKVIGNSIQDAFITSLTGTRTKKPELCSYTYGDTRFTYVPTGADISAKFPVQIPDVVGKPGYFFVQITKSAEGLTGAAKVGKVLNKVAGVFSKKNKGTI